MAEFDYGRNMFTPDKDLGISQAKTGPKMGRKPNTSAPCRSGSGKRYQFGGKGTPGSGRSNVGKGATPYDK